MTAVRVATPVLKPGVVYVSDNGRAICLHCAGASAKYTGRDISGQAVMPFQGAALAEWLREFGSLSCESGCTKIAEHELRGTLPNYCLRCGGDAGVAGFCVRTNVKEVAA